MIEAIRHALAQAGLGFALTSQEGDNSPYASHTSVFMGWSLSKQEEEDGPWQWEDLGYWDTLAVSLVFCFVWTFVILRVMVRVAYLTHNFCYSLILPYLLITLHWPILGELFNIELGLSEYNLPFSF